MLDGVPVAQESREELLEDVLTDCGLEPGEVGHVFHHLEIGSLGLGQAREEAQLWHQAYLDGLLKARPFDVVDQHWLIGILDVHAVVVLGKQ